MALTYIETVRLLMGDLDAGDNNFFSPNQWAHLFGTASYDDLDDESKVNLVEVAIDALRILSIYHADARPERSKKLDDRVDALGRWPEAQKALYLVDGVPDGIGEADAFRGPMGLPGTDSTVPGPPGPPGSPANTEAHNVAADSHADLRAAIDAAVAGEGVDLTNYVTTTALAGEAAAREAADNAHNAANTAHTVIRQRIEEVEQSVPSNQDIQDYVDSGVAQHAGMPNAHHIPPEGGSGAAGNGFLALAANGQFQPPTADNVGRASIRNGQVYVYVVNPGNPGTDESWDWNQMTTARVREVTGVNNAFYRGTHSNEDSLGSPADGHYAYITNRHTMRRYEGYWEDAPNVGAVLQGPFNSQADAEAHVKTVGLWAWWPGPQGLQYLNAYVAPTAADPDTYSIIRTGYTSAEWLAQFAASNIQNLANVPDPQARSYLRWNEAGTELENAASPADEAVGDAKGPVWATSPVLTTGVTYANNDEIPFPGTEHWNLSDAAPGGVAHGTGSTRGQLAMPAQAPTGVIGVWIQALIDGVIEDEAALVYGHGNAFHSQLGASDIHLRLDDGGTFFLQARWQRADYIALYGADTTIPANVTVQIRPLLIRGAQGEPGEGAAEVTAHEADATAHPAVVEAHNTGVNSHQDIRGVVTNHGANINSHIGAFATRFNSHNADGAAHGPIRSAISSEIDGDVSAHNLQSGAHFTEFEAEFDDHNSRASAHSAAVDAHNADGGAHPGLAVGGGDVATHNTASDAHAARIGELILEHDESQTSHEFIRNLITDRVEISDWLHNTTYFIGQTVLQSGRYYFCIGSHTSGGTLDSAPSNNPTHWLQMSFAPRMIGAMETFSLSNQNNYAITTIRPTTHTPVPEWLQIRPGLSQTTHGEHGEYVRINYAEWLGLDTVSANTTRNATNTIVIGNYGATGGVEIYIGRDSSGYMAVAASSAGTLTNFTVYGE